MSFKLTSTLLILLALHSASARLQMPEVSKCPTKQAGMEPFACYDLYAPVAGHFANAGGIKVFSNDCEACAQADVVSYQEIEMCMMREENENG